MSIIDKIQEDEDDYERLCEFFGIYRIPYGDNFYPHYKELKEKLTEKLEYDSTKN